MSVRHPRVDSGSGVGRKSDLEKLGVGGRQLICGITKGSANRDQVKTKGCAQDSPTLRAK